MSSVNSLDSTHAVRDKLSKSDRNVPALQHSPWLTTRQLVDIVTALDAAIVFFSFILADLAYVATMNVGLQVGPQYSLVAALTALAYYIVSRTNSSSGDRLSPNSLLRILRLLLITFSAVIVLAYGLKQAEVHSRLWLATAFLFAFVMLVARNYFLQRMLKRGQLREHIVERIALFGDPAVSAMIKSSLEAKRDGLYSFMIYSFGGKTTQPTDDTTVVNQLIADGLDGAFHRVIFCLPQDQQHNLKRFVDAIDLLPVRIQTCVAQSELQMLNNDLLVSPAELLISLDHRPYDDWNVALKRVMDLTLGSVCLMLAIPVMIVAAIAIKLDSRGPVFFRQRRHGWNHSVISVWKLRTMTVQEDGSSVRQAERSDPRVTRVGAFLRKTSIDELPQLFNVLAGSMSLVGPRPHALAHNLQYSELIKSYATRHKVKPGITGWAQVSGLRGGCVNVSDMEKRAEADLWYIRNWSIMLDLKIVFLTPFVMLFQDSAY